MSAALGSQVAANIVAHGASVVVTRPADASTRTVSVVPRDISKQEAMSLNVEGYSNVSDPTPQAFLFAGGTDVRQLDRFSWNGWTWQLLRCVNNVQGNVTRAVGVRIQ